MLSILGFSTIILFMFLVMANQLAWGTSGNISARLDSNRMIITASGKYMVSPKHDDFVEC